MYKQCKYGHTVLNNFMNNTIKCPYKDAAVNSKYKIPVCPTDSGTDEQCNSKCWATTDK